MQGSRVLLKGAAIMTAVSLLGKLLGVLLRLVLYLPASEARGWGFTS